MVVVAYDFFQIESSLMCRTSSPTPPKTSAPSLPFPTGRAPLIVSAFHSSRCAGAANQMSS